MSKRPFVYVRRYAKFATRQTADAAMLNLAADKNVKPDSIEIDTNNITGETSITWQERSFLPKRV